MRASSPLRASHGMPQMGVQEPSAGWLELASSPGVVRRALAYAVIVGAILIAINHGDALVRGELDSTRLFKMGLTVLVPYTVSTLSSVGALRQAARAEGGADSRSSD